MANWTTGLSSEEIASHYSLTTDFKEVEKALSGTTKSLKSIARQTSGIIARTTVKQIKAVIKSGIYSHKGKRPRTGELKKAYTYKVHKNGTAAIFPKAINGNNKIFPKCSVLSYGHSGATRRARSFDVKAVAFVQAGDKWIEQGQYIPEINKMIDKTLDKYWS